MSDDTRAPQQREIPPAAQRALAEADERRKAREAEIAKMPTELGGRDGPEPVRYGDWEKKGLAIDF
ncbi:DUF1674 domain-containing protein [Celeribacter indicus]|uniref:Dihydrodipicolinate reductase n=1 Tax=Celeribacter indicus TaxID=1208324 RepID=A0A0B5DY89_9RHOB|nr:DUF1674 domain-containing protein [Celeribacter indicus]AJE45157.1 hypothetical protein P73_0442 [Celeribacter indicus]SDX26200.1 hypothetical protein SAMN05443573_11926 [Celeribacter indicus]